MTINIKPRTLATGPDNPAKQVSVDVWNAGHLLTGLPSMIIGTDSLGQGVELSHADAGAALADNTPYGPSWNGALAPPSKNAVYDEMETRLEVEDDASWSPNSKRFMGDGFAVGDASTSGLARMYQGSAGYSGGFELDQVAYSGGIWIEVPDGTLTGTANFRRYGTTQGWTFDYPVTVLGNSWVQARSFYPTASAAGVYSGVIFQTVGEVTTASLWGGHSTDPVFYIDAEKIVLENLAETVTFATIDATGIDIPTGHTYKINGVPIGGGGGLTNGDKGDVVVAGGGSSLTVESATPAGGVFAVTGRETIATTTGAALTINAGAQTNVQSLIISNMGNGTGGIQLESSMAGRLSIGDLTGPLGSAFSYYGENRTLDFLVANNAYDASPQAFKFHHSAAPTRNLMVLKHDDVGMTGDFLRALNSVDAVKMSLSSAGNIALDGDVHRIGPQSGVARDTYLYFDNTNYYNNLTFRHFISGSPTTDAVITSMRDQGLYVGGYPSITLRIGDPAAPTQAAAFYSLGYAIFYAQDFTIGNSSNSSGGANEYVHLNSTGAYAGIDFHHWSPAGASLGIAGNLLSYYGYGFYIDGNPDLHLRCGPDSVMAMVIHEIDATHAQVTVAGKLAVDDDPYSSSWNGSTDVPTKNAVYDKIQTVVAGGGGGLTDGDMGDVVVGGSGTTLTVESATPAGGTFNVTGAVVATGHCQFDATGGWQNKFVDTSGAPGACINLGGNAGYINASIRPAAGQKGVVSFTEDTVADRWSIGIKPADGNLYFAADSSLTAAKATLTSAGGFSVTGKLSTIASAAGGAGFILPHGAAPTSPVNGDVWTTTAALLYRLNGATVTSAVLEGNTFTGKNTTLASAAGGAGFNLPHGAAPTSPVNGDVWTTTGGLFGRINGVTMQNVFAGSVTTSGLTMNTARLLGRTTAAVGAPEELTAAAAKTLLAIVTSDVAAAAGNVVSANISTSAGAYSEVAMAANTLLGRGASGNIAACTLGASLAFTGAALGVAANQVIRSLSIVIDGGGSAITTGQKGHIEIPFACTLTGITLMADQSGSIVIDVWKDTYANFPPTVADTITASAKPTLSSAAKAQDNTLTGWNKAWAAGDILAFNVDSATTVTRVTLSMKVNVT